MDTTTMTVLHAVSPTDGKQYDTASLRNSFLLQDLQQEDTINLTYTQYDRLIAGVASPVFQTLTLNSYNNLKTENFLDRREMGIINVAGNGTVTVDGKKFSVEKYDCVYAGKGVEAITFSSVSENEPALFFLLSSPAHQQCPTRFMKSHEATPVNTGSAATSNERTIYKYIHKDGIESCQLVMGLTRLRTGSVWNTMPAHVHDRRSEVYFYFDVPEGQSVLHLMGEPKETRHLFVKNHEAIVSPTWSIHSGCGTSNYSFIWGMAGENIEYTDMDLYPADSLQ